MVAAVPSCCNPAVNRRSKRLCGEDGSNRGDLCIAGLVMTPSFVAGTLPRFAELVRLHNASGWSQSGDPWQRGVMHCNYPRMDGLIN